MTEQKPVNRIPVAMVAGVSAAVLAAAGGSWWTINSIKSPPKLSPVATTPTSPPPLVVQPLAQKAQIYWLKDTGKNLEVVAKSITVAADESPNAVLKAAFDNLLAGATDEAVSSGIPEGTKLRNVTIKKDEIHLDLSQEFTTGGGSTSMTGRLAQVIYTATTLQPNARVWINVEGEPLQDLGGEGLELDQPMTRQSFKENFTL